MQNLNLDLLIN